MTVLRKYWWPLLVSFGVHATIASALAVSPAARRPVPVPLESRDVWIGDTVDIGALSPEKTPEDVSKSVDTPPPKSTAPRVPATERTASHAHTAEARAPRDSDSSLAARILAYVPHREAATREPEPTTTSSGRGVPGGMQRSDEAIAPRGFAKAFTRALPAANTSDPAWGTLPLGTVGTVRVSVLLDDDGAIADAKIWDKTREPPAPLVRLVDRTLLLLRGGRFALARTGTGKETLKLDVTLSERPMESGPLALGFEAPSSGNPGRAYFQLASGRLVEAKVTIEPS